MGFRLPAIRRASFKASQVASIFAQVPKGYLAVYVGEKQKRFVITNRFIFSPTWTARYPFGTSTDFEGAWFAANDAFLIPGRRKPIVVCAENWKENVVKKEL